MTTQRGQREARRSQRASTGRPSRIHLWILLAVFLVSAWSLFRLPSARTGSQVAGQAPQTAPHGWDPPPGAEEIPGSLSPPARQESPGRSAEALVQPERPQEAPSVEHETQPQRAALEILVRAAGSRGRPCAGASVELGHSAPDAEHETIRLLRSDARGVVRSSLQAGTLRLVAWTERGTSQTLFAELVPGTTTRHVLEVEPAHELAGRVLDAVTSLPVEDAAVFVWTFSERDVVRTAADGSFTHPRFPRSGMAEQIRVEAPGYGAAVRYLSVGAAGEWELPDPLEETANRTGTGVPFVEFALVPEVVLRGEVRDQSGRALAGACIEVEGYYRVLPTVASLDGAQNVTDEHGRFEVRGLRSDIGHSLYAFAEECSEATVEVEAGQGGIVDVGVLELARESIYSGVVFDPEGFPAVDLLVVLTPIDEGEDTPAPGHARDVPARVRLSQLETRTSEEGTFLFEGLRPIDYAVTLARDAEPLLSTEARPEPGGAFPHAELSLAAGLATLRGRVRGARGGNALVELRRNGHVARVRTDAEGRFRVVGLDLDAPYELIVHAAAGPATDVMRAFREAWAYEEPVLDLEPLAPGTSVSLAAQDER